MAKTLHVISLGCTKNLVDTEVMLGRLRDYTLIDDATQSDVIIINTCGFIDAAKQESINTILSTHEARKEDSILVVAGCLSERYREELAVELPEVDLFTGVGDYERIDALIGARESRFSDEVYLIDGAQRVITGSTYHAYVKLAEGCNQQCSFCAIPSFKGKLHSRSLDSVVLEVEALVRQGYYDFSFISQDSSSYLRDQKMLDGLVLLIKRIELIEGVKSARILYLYPSTTTPKLIQAIAKSTVFHPYFDMPIQHINDFMLKTMRRGFGKAQTVALLEAMRAVPNALVRTSVIVGHPHESDADFEELLAFVRDFGFDSVTVFAYSNEEGTSAYEMEQIEDKIIDKRIKALQKVLKAKAKARLNAYVGTSMKIVVDGPSSEHESLLSAKALMWAPQIDGEILVNESEITPIEYGVIYNATITSIAGTTLMATIVGHA
ncbi:MAG: ribosomal protein S12 methylthiotransferase [Sulfurovum sp. PC08-66]|nr:MAG: ribosomal protein S12 methylthiotransferase [Sulfurovum sp. PC08-66]KIM12645.1 MAG: ribosomal protein S12 methylthiotransferase [Sulfuricurvum sp. PC08-66]